MSRSHPGWARLRAAGAGDDSAWAAFAPVIGYARSPMTDEKFRARMRTAVLRIANPYRPGVAISLEARQDHLREMTASVHGIHDLDRALAGKAHRLQPVEEIHRLVVETYALESIESQCGIAKPLNRYSQLRTPPISSGSEVVGAAMSAPVGSNVSSFNARGLRRIRFSYGPSYWQAWSGLCTYAAWPRARRLDQ